jgi:hypothetical protein
MSTFGWLAYPVMAYGCLLKEDFATVVNGGSILVKLLGKKRRILYFKTMRILFGVRNCHFAWRRRRDL